MITSTSPGLKPQHRAIWAAGNYADVAATSPCAARTSPDVTGLDLVPSLLDAARSPNEDMNVATDGSLHIDGEYLVTVIRR